MTYQTTTVLRDMDTPPKLPSWVTRGRAQTLEDVAFRSGAALSVLDQLVCDRRHAVPVTLLANRLALTAATATSKLEGRLAHQADIRDAYHLTPLGDARGPDGDLLAFWRCAVALRLTDRDWLAGLTDLVGPGLAGCVAPWLDTAAGCAKSHAPLAGCVAVMRAVLQADDRAERVACLLSDVVLARILNRSHILPVTTARMTNAMVRGLIAGEQGIALKVQQSILWSLQDSIDLARDLSAKAQALLAVAPKLRAKGSQAAVDLFLSQDAVAPSAMLSPMINGTTIPMTDRAARRLCDRLVELGVVRELTGRPTFRLYGIAP